MSVSFVVSGSQSESSLSLTLAASGLPDGATHEPPLPAMGPAEGVSSTFHWIGWSDHLGSYVISYTVSDSNGTARTCEVLLEVVQCVDAAVCDDGNPCTQDRCTSARVCENLPEAAGATCDLDGLACSRDECDGAGNCVVIDDNCEVIPTVSEWGMVVLALLLLVVAKIYFGTAVRPVSSPALS
jgi:hypothetical protein